MTKRRNPLAKTSGPFLSTDASGSIAKTLTASKWKSRAYIRGHSSPSNPQTTAQQTNRALMAAAIVAWRLLTPTEKTAQNLLGAAQVPPIPGYNYFLRTYILGGAPPTPWDLLEAMEYSTDALAIGTYLSSHTSLDPYSEGSIKTQGNFALKFIAAQTDSLNQTLTRSFGNIITGGTPIADSEYSAGHTAAHGCNGNLTDIWASTNSAYPHYWYYDFGTVKKIIATKLRIYKYVDVNPGCAMKNFTLRGSQNATDWTTLLTGQATDCTGFEWQTWTFSNTTPYRYYMVHITDAWRVVDNICGFVEVELIEQDPLDLSDIQTVRLDLRASRTGQNLKIHFQKPWSSVYPAAQNGTYVKSTSQYDGEFNPWFSTTPGLSLTGSWNNNGWIALSGQATNQRFHIDLGAATLIKRIYYENAHASGTNGNSGVQHFTLWGSNNAGAFAELTYSIDTNWTQITTDQDHFEQHPDLDQADPHYMEITNAVAYRYYALKCADNYGGTYLGFRRVELQTGSDLTLTPPIGDADTYDAFDLDLSLIANVNKNALSKIVLEILNADVETWYYLDNIRTQ